MKKSQSYSINFATNTITVTKAFLEGASQMGTKDYNTMMELRSLNMRIVPEVVRHPNRKASWTFAKMERYVDKFGNAETKAKYAEMKASNPYPTVWSWFVRTFPEYRKGRKTDSKVIPMPTMAHDALEDVGT